jgi:hypothetical protein
MYNEEIEDELVVQQEEVLSVNDEQSRVSSITGREDLLEEQEELDIQEEGVLTQLRERKSPSKKRKRPTIQQLRVELQLKKQKENNK